MSTAISPRLKALNEAPLDTWIALSEDESKIIAVGSSYEEAVKNSQNAGVSDPTIVKTPPQWASLSI
jgi:hypothetical protein